jgi:glucose-1-phosphatase
MCGVAIEVVLCDLGGVLIDYSFELTVREWARTARVDPKTMMGKLVIDEAWTRFEVNSLTEREFFEHIRRQFGLYLTEAELVRGWNAVYIGVNDEVADLLKEVVATGTRLVAVTNTNATHQRLWRDRFAEHLTMFAAVYSSCDIGYRKPDAQFFDRVLSVEKVQPRNALFIDDLEENVRGARRSGIPAVRFSDRRSLRDALARHGLVERQSP